MVKQTNGSRSLQDDALEEKTVPFFFSKTAAACIRRAAEDANQSPEDWLLDIVSIHLLTDSGYSNLHDFLEDDFTKNSQYEFLEKLKALKEQFSATKTENNL